MKILVVTHAFPFPDFLIRRGGRPMYNSLELLKANFPDIEIDVAFFVPKVPKFVYRFLDNEKLENLPKEYTLGEIKVSRLYYIPRMPFVVNQFLKQRTLRKFLKKLGKNNLQPDVIYSESIYPDFVISQDIAQEENIKHIAIMRGSDVHTAMKSSKTLMTAVKSKVKDFSNKLVLISVSQKLASIFNSLLKTAIPVNELYTFIDFEKFYQGDRTSRQNKFLFVGTLVETKGIFEIYQAFKELIQEGHNISLTMIGKGEGRGKLEGLIQKDNLNQNFFLLGWQTPEEVRAHMLSHDILIFGSYKEGLPNVVVEAVASKMIIISTNVGGVKEICPENEAFHLVESKDYLSIKNKIQLLLSSKKDMTLALRQNYNSAYSKFSKKAHLNALKNIFESHD